MKFTFYSALAALALYEFLRVYFIMPLPGSQCLNTLDAAYLLHTWRWTFRITLLLLIAAGSLAAFRARRKWLPALAVLLAGAVAQVQTGGVAYLAHVDGFVFGAVTARFFEGSFRTVDEPRVD